MRERPVVRLALVCLLLLVLGGQLVHYAADEETHRVYPAGSELATDFETYHGREVDVWLTVETRTEGGFRATSGWTVTADSLPDRLDTGEKAQVYGIARPGPSIDAQRVVVTDAENRTYMLVVSALALLLVTGYTLSQWRLSLRSGYFLPRNQSTETQARGTDD